MWKFQVRWTMLAVPGKVFETTVEGMDQASILVDAIGGAEWCDDVWIDCDDSESKRIAPTDVEAVWNKYVENPQREGN